MRLPLLIGLACACAAPHQPTGLLDLTEVSEEPAARPNVVLLMADDLGWGDPGYQGHPTMRTPHLDAWAEEGIVLDRFYAAAPVCSPTRASVMTGRHPWRTGIEGANNGHLLGEEHTLAELLGAAGYRTGFFGKWHLGTFTRDIVDSNRGGRPEHDEHFAPPTDHGFDEYFATEAKVPTFDPMKHPDKDRPYGTHYWKTGEIVVTEGLNGDDSRVIVDRAVPFIRDAARRDQPFFAVVWFHAPHLPVEASEADRALYAGEGEFAERYRGCITALDREVGRIRATLEELGLAEDTLIAFCSDNGPEGRKDNGQNGSTAGLRGRKRSLYDGGVRVPGLLSWPRGLVGGQRCAVPFVTYDYLPTVLDAVGLELPADRTLDGRSMLPHLRGESVPASPKGFAYGKQVAWIEGRYKLVGKTQQALALYDLEADPGETRDLTDDEPERRARMEAALRDWLVSVRASARRADDS